MDKRYIYAVNLPNQTPNACRWNGKTENGRSVWPCRQACMHTSLKLMGDGCGTKLCKVQLIRPILDLVVDVGAWPWCLIGCAQLWGSECFLLGLANTGCFKSRGDPAAFAKLFSPARRRCRLAGCRHVRFGTGFLAGAQSALGSVLPFFAEVWHKPGSDFADL